MTQIWCLFSIQNLHDQPYNNLERWWAEKPSIERLASYMAMPLDKTSDEGIVKIVSLWQGQEVRLFNEAIYRLQAVNEGESP